MAGALERLKANVLTRWRRGLLGGFLAFLVFNTLVIYVTPKFFGEPLDVALAMIVFHVDFSAADVIRFLVGSAVFPLIYVAVFLPFVPLVGALRGLVFGGLLWLLVGMMVTPGAGVGWFFGGMKPALLALMTHLIYGVILGLVVGPPV
ncbi:MAG: hypothetical protein P8X65_01695 [Syntrophobacterales bacterium]|jgi:hypothetical protein